MQSALRWRGCALCALGVCALSCSDPANPTTHSDVSSDHTIDLRPAGNSRVLFSSDRDGNFEIYAMNPRGRDVVRLTNDPSPDMFPQWSPDGGRIVFIRNGDVWVMNAD